MSDFAMVEVSRAEWNAAEGVAAAAEGALYCVDCWDNPAHNLCPKHLDPLRAALELWRVAHSSRGGQPRP